MFKKYLLFLSVFFIGMELINMTSFHVKKVVIDRHVQKNFSSDFKELNNWICNDVALRGGLSLDGDKILRKFGKLSMMITLIDVFKWIFMVLFIMVFSFVGSRINRKLNGG